MRLQEIKERVKLDKSISELSNPIFPPIRSFAGRSITEDMEYLINLVEAMRAEEPNFWGLYDRYQDKITEKLKLKDEVKRHETMWKDLKSDAEITKDWRLYRVCSVALREVE